MFPPLPSNLLGSFSLPYFSVPSLNPSSWGPHLFSTLAQHFLAPTLGAPPPYQPLQRMRSCILDAHKELFWSHAIQESRPGQGLEHQGCVGKVSGAGASKSTLQVSSQSVTSPPLFFTPRTITLSQEKADPIVLAPPGKLQESNRGV